MRANSSARIVEIAIPSSTPWTDTGIDVPNGSLLSIEAKGQVIYWDVNNARTDANGVNWDGERFFQNAILPDAIVVSLIGKIGGTTNLGSGTPVPAGRSGDGAGFVGKSYHEFIPESGRLFLGFNDTPNAFGDNIGSFHVTISIATPPQHAPIGVNRPSPNYGAMVNSNSAASTTTFTATASQTVADPTPKSIDIGIYAGVEIKGFSNQVCGIQYCCDLSDTNQWQGLTNIIPDSDDIIWFDKTKTAGSGQRFYRVLSGPISVP